MTFKANLVLLIYHMARQFLDRKTKSQLQGLQNRPLLSLHNPSIMGKTLNIQQMRDLIDLKALQCNLFADSLVKQIRAQLESNFLDRLQI